MSTAFRFSRRIDIGDIPAPAKSAGAHLSAKLELFHTDERTLTDELCDMLCIWLGMQAEFSASTSPLAFDLTLSKTTVGEEAQNGADLELIVSTPLGTKRCLMQAKVLDPSTKRLRCDSSPGWRKLRKQLVAARKDAGDLAFLLIYVPASVLDADHFGFTTYEQGLYLKAGDNVGASGNLPAYFGATLIQSAANSTRAVQGWRAVLATPSRATAMSSIYLVFRFRDGWRAFCAAFPDSWDCGWRGRPIGLARDPKHRKPLARTRPWLRRRSVVSSAATGHSQSNTIRVPFDGAFVVVFRCLREDLQISRLCQRQPG